MDRLFLAIQLSEAAKRAVADIKSQVQAQMQHSRITWVSDSNFHITLHFLGDVVNEKRNELINRMRRIEFPKSFELKLDRIDAFPNKKRPQTIFVDTTSHPSVHGLHMRTGKLLAELGFDIDERPWHPHITVGRVRIQSEVLQPEKIHIEPAAFDVSSFELMKSTLTPNGSRYEAVESIRL